MSDLEVRKIAVHRLHPVKVLDSVTGTGAGETKTLPGVYGNFSFQLVHTGSPTSVVATLQGSLNGTNWFTILTWNSASQSNGQAVFINNRPAEFIRGNLTTLTGGTAPTVSAWFGTSR